MPTLSSTSTGLLTNPAVPRLPGAPTLITFQTNTVNRAPWNLDETNYFACDAVVSVEYTGDVEVTDHPVEKGSDISDNARPMPEVVKIHGFVSSTPISSQLRNLNPGATYPAPSAPQTGQQASRAQAAFTLLKDAKDNATFLSVVTDLYQFDSMIIKSLTLTRDNTTGDSLDFTATLRHVRIVSSQIATLVPVTAQHGVATDKGRDSTKPATTKQQEDLDGLTKIANGISHLLGQKYQGNTQGQ